MVNEMRSLYFRIFLLAWKILIMSVVQNIVIICLHNGFVTHYVVQRLYSVISDSRVRSSRGVPPLWLRYQVWEKVVNHFNTIPPTLLAHTLLNALSSSCHTGSPTYRFTNIFDTDRAAIQLLLFPWWPETNFHSLLAVSLQFITVWCIHRSRAVNVEF